MQLLAEKKVFFLSDFHLGIPDHSTSLERERRIVAFLESIRKEAATIFIVGDMFDFWYEYRQVVPKGYVRLLGKLAEFTDAGIPVHFFCRQSRYVDDRLLPEGIGCTCLL